MANSTDDCDLWRLPPWYGVKGALYKHCVELNASEGKDEHGNPIPGAPTPSPDSSGGSFFGIPIPGSAWQRHIMFRAAEVIVGIAIIVAGVKAFTGSSQTVRIITEPAKKAIKKL